MAIELNDNQKEINPNPLYWEWFQKWWDEDFSWEGLADKTADNGDSLQVRYATHQTNLIDRFDKQWNPLHLPDHDASGNSTFSPFTRDQERYVLGILDTFRNKKPSTLYGVIKGIRLQNDCDKLSWCLIHNIHDNRYSYTEAQNCYVQTVSNKSIVFTNCSITSASFSSPHLTDQAIEFNHCTFANQLKVVGNGVSEFIISGGTTNSALELHTNKLKIQGLETPSIQITAVGHPQRDTAISIDVTNNESCSIFLTKTQIDEKNKITSDISLKLNRSHRVTIENYIIDQLELDTEGLELLKIINSQINKSTLSLDGFHVDNLLFDRSIFKGGIRAVNATFYDTIEINGCNIFSEADFSNSTFTLGIEIGGRTNDDGTIKRSTLEHANFTETAFHKGAENNHICVDFNDTDFLGSAIFDQSLFDGIPKFHNSTLPQETSFHDLKPIPEIEQQDINDPQIYGHYQASFRTLRQHMEKNNSYADAFEFGRMEMIAKQRRKGSNDVPWWERGSTRLYGALAKHGQSALRPLCWLFAINIASLFAQAIIVSQCFWFNKTCLFDSVLAIEALQKSSLFALPPFSTLVVKDFSTKPNERISNSLETSLTGLSHFISGFGVFTHAILTSLCVFLFLLAMKRRLQIR